MRNLFGQIDGTEQPDVAGIDAGLLWVGDGGPGWLRGGSSVVVRRIAMDLDAALGTLAHDVRLCIVLAYHEGMTHDEIASLTDIPVGTVKSHIRRGTLRLREQLAAYTGTAEPQQDT
jgi:DNA-directed RNA polymerase specialized sigma24 family protein